jgi:4-hydroxy-2-oxoheptanedioate aldolase
MTGSQIRQKLHRGECVFGTHIASLMNPSAAALAADMELDFAFFCTEHMPLDRTEVGLLCRYYAARGISPIVRVPSPNATSIATMLDGGAEGIVVPYLETVEEVKQAVGAVRYRPIKGAQLADFISGRVPVSEKMQAFLDDFNRETYLIIGVESVAAVENLDRLLDVPGVDGVFLGPHDLCASLGIPNEYSNPLFIDTVEAVTRRCRQRSVGVGLHTHLLQLDPGVLDRFLRAGMNWLINGSDIITMRNAMRADLRALRQLTQAAPAEAGLAAGPAKSCIAPSG